MTHGAWLSWRLESSSIPSVSVQVLFLLFLLAITHAAADWTQVIGIVLVVTADSFFVTLFVVIIFHQMFEGFALGTRIVALPRSTTRLTKLTLAGAFTLITPIGMAIGLGVLHRFNGNDWETIIALATLDSISAGILVWVGLVDLLARDWIFGYLKNAKPLKVGVGMAGLVGGMVIMGVLGKWA